jgi:beta-lactamase class A
MEYRHKAYFSTTARIAIALALLALGIVIGQYTDTFLPGAFPNDATDVSSEYSYIDPLLFCADRDLKGQTAAFSQRMQDELTALIDNEKRAGALSDASVLYRDLSNGPRVTVNGDMASAPASLLKVPLALSIYRRAATDPSFLQKKVKMDIPDQNAGEHFTAPHKAEPGKEYTVDELLQLSLIDSDNNATDLLIMQLSDDELRNSYEDLGIQVPIDNPSAYTMNVAVYSSFFRILYNASYLSRDMSERLLSNLAGSTFTKGIVAGVPSGTKVAHKFGEHVASDGTKQLHDCGVVYRTGRPYLLCVMTKGNDFEKLASAIADISKEVWDLGK